MSIKVYKPLRGASIRLVEGRPSRRSGLMSLTNITGQMRFKHYLFGSNTEDLRNDWRTVGHDIRKAMRMYGK